MKRAILYCDYHATSYDATDDVFCPQCRKQLEEQRDDELAKADDASRVLNESQIDLRAAVREEHRMSDNDLLAAVFDGPEQGTQAPDPDNVVASVTREARAEFASILWQVVQQRTADAVEGIARMSQPEVGEKLAQTPEQMLREYMLDIEVARQAASMLQDLTEGK